VLKTETVARGTGQKNDDEAACVHRGAIASGAARSGCDVDVQDLVILGQCPAFLVFGLKAELNSLADVGEGLFMGSALADTSWDQRTFGYQPAVFTRCQHHRKFHE
jgi:hypothetical protein